MIDIRQDTEDTIVVAYTHVVPSEFICKLVVELKEKHDCTVLPIMVSDRYFNKGEQ
jgi:hypothetical protein